MSERIVKIVDCERKSKEKRKGKILARKNWEIGSIDDARDD